MSTAYSPSAIAHGRTISSYIVAAGENPAPLLLDRAADPDVEIAAGRDERPVDDQAERASSLCLHSSTTVRLKLGSTSCGIDSSSDGASEGAMFLVGLKECLPIVSSRDGPDASHR